VLRVIFEPKCEAVAGDWRRLHNEELHKFCSSLNTITAIKLRRVGQATYIALREI
jgi:hypothetical protein